MNLLTRLSIKYKINLIAIVGILGIVAYLLFNYSVNSSNTARMEAIRDVHFPVLKGVEAIVNASQQIINTFTSAVGTGDEELLKEAQASAEHLNKSLDTILSVDGHLQKQIGQYKVAFTKYFNVAFNLSKGMIDETIDMSKVGIRAKEMNALQDAFRREMKNLRSFAFQRFTRTIDEANHAARTAVHTGLIIAIAMVVILGCLGFFIGDAITRNISAVVKSLREMASGQGDLRKRLQSKTQDEVGELVNEFNRFVEKLQGIIRDISDSVGSLNQASRQMSLVTTQSRESIVKQQADIDQVATAMNEMSATVHEVARNAADAAGAAKKADAEAGNGRQVVAQAVGTIDKLASDVDEGANVIHQLAEDSENIGTVLDVIKSIAEQTNLLALNAAIEAARAGEQGRGFAVVADEVRTLAQRTQQSTQEIQAIIEKLQSGAIKAEQVMKAGRTQAQSSVEESSRAGASLVSITEMVARINDMNTQIASAAEEQTAVAEEVNHSIVAISDVATQTSRSSEQLQHSSEDVSSMATQLHGLVAKFQV